MSDVRDDGFGAVFDRTFPLAERLARRITGDASVSEELAAEALTRLYARWWRMANADHHDAWVLRVTTNLAIGAVRKRRTVPLTTAPAVVGESDDQVVLRVALAEAMHQLSKRQREVVALRYLTDLRETEVASMLGVTTGSVKTHLHRALAAMRSSFHVSSEHDVEVHLEADR